jgi:hypothetical protein
MEPMKTLLCGYASAEQLAEVHVATAIDGPASGSRVVSVQMLGGWAFRVLLDRGADIGSAWYGGMPVAWIGPVGERGPLAQPREFDWLTAFGGGLVTTCGLRNVGLPSEGHGLHGRFSHSPARLVAVDRRIDDSGLSVVVKTVTDELEPPTGHFRLERTIAALAGSGHLSLLDVTTNLGCHEEPAPLLYHVNLGYPILQPGTKIAWPGGRATPRDADAAAQMELVDAAGDADDEAPEAVFEHEVVTGAGESAAVIVTSPPAGLRCAIGWSTDTLQRLHQWMRRSRGWYVLGVEPANCSVLGRAHDRAEGRLESLAPGSSRVTKLTFDISRI